MKSFTDDKPIVISKQQFVVVLSSGSKNEHRTSCLSKIETVTKQYNLLLVPDMSKHWTWVEACGIYPLQFQEISTNAFQHYEVRENLFSTATLFLNCK